VENQETHETLGTKHQANTNKTKNTAQKFKKMSNTEPDNKYNYNDNGKYNYLSKRDKRTNNDLQSSTQKHKDRSSTYRSTRSSFLVQLNLAPDNSNCRLFRSKISGSFDFNTTKL
jgi:hypothetical protein